MGSPLSINPLAFIYNLSKEIASGHYREKVHTPVTISPEKCESHTDIFIKPINQTFVSRKKLKKLKKEGKKARDCLDTIRLVIRRYLHAAVCAGKLPKPPGGIYNAIYRLHTGNNIIRFTKANPNDPEKKGMEAEAGHIVPDLESAKEAIAYIDTALKNQYPVMAGVSYVHPKKKERHADGVTDHIVLITGKICDESNHVIYAALDPGRKNGKSKIFLYLTKGNLLIKPAEVPIDGKGKNVERGYEVTYVVKYRFPIPPPLPKVS